jgi:hypothetical protein
MELRQSGVRASSIIGSPQTQGEESRFDQIHTLNNLDSVPNPDPTQNPVPTPDPVLVPNLDL